MGTFFFILASVSCLSVTPVQGIYSFSVRLMFHLLHSLTLLKNIRRVLLTRILSEEDGSRGGNAGVWPETRETLCLSACYTDIILIWLHQPHFHWHADHFQMKLLCLGFSRLMHIVATVCGVVNFSNIRRVTVMKSEGYQLVCWRTFRSKNPWESI